MPTITDTEPLLGRRVKVFKLLPSRHVVCLTITSDLFLFLKKNPVLSKWWRVSTRASSAWDGCSRVVLGTSSSRKSIVAINSYFETLSDDSILMSPISSSINLITDEMRRHDFRKAGKETYSRVLVSVGLGSSMRTSVYV